MIFLFLILNLIPAWIVTGIIIYEDVIDGWEDIVGVLFAACYIMWPLLILAVFVIWLIKTISKPAMFIARLLDAIRKETNGKNKK